MDWENLDEAFRELEATCEDVIRGMSIELWNGILSKTPQFHGRMAASWSYSLNTPEFYDRSGQVDAESLKLPSGRYTEFGTFKGLYRGHPAAIAVANKGSAGRDRGFKLGDVIWIANGVDHGEGPYSQAIEDGEVFLRAENRPGAPLRRSVDTLVARYAEDVSPRRAYTLSNLVLGGRW